jgi:hypothetical protein
MPHHHPLLLPPKLITLLLPTLSLKHQSPPRLLFDSTRKPPKLSLSIVVM